jgi:predicted N-formylglutamate amidohydrolase
MLSLGEDAARAEAARASGAPATDVVSVRRRDGGGVPVFICEHASNRFPDRFGTLGLTAEERLSHIAWDPGALSLAEALSARFDAPLVAAEVSRLLYDCNRPPEHPGAIAVRSEVTDIPGNAALDAAGRAARTEAIYRPFRAAADALLDERAASRRACAVVTIHSFTPTYLGRPRAVEIGILHDEDARLADALLHAVPTDGGGYRIARNEPYGPADGVTHSLAIYGIRRGLPNVMIEVRNDLLATPDGARRVADTLDAMLRRALPAIGLTPGREEVGHG